MSHTRSHPILLKENHSLSSARRPISSRNRTRRKKPHSNRTQSKIDININKKGALMDPRKSSDAHGESKKEQKELIPVVDQKPTLMERITAMAQKKNNPRTQVAGTLLKLTEIEAEIDNLRQSSASNKIKRFYLNYHKRGLKVLLKDSMLHKREESLSHELRQSIERQGKQAEEFKLESAQQERKDKAALEIMQGEYEAKIREAMSLKAWSKLKNLAEEADGSQQGLQARQERERQTRLEAFKNKNKQAEAK